MLIGALEKGAFEVVMPDEVDWLREGYSRNPNGLLPGGKGAAYMASAKKRRCRGAYVVELRLSPSFAPCAAFAFSLERRCVLCSATSPLFRLARLRAHAESRGAWPWGLTRGARHTRPTVHRLGLGQRGADDGGWTSDLKR